jgi:hypothetical protein
MLDCPVAVEFGEMDKDEKWLPYLDSMLDHTTTGIPCHYLIPPRAQGRVNEVVLTNSKEADHNFGFRYSWLTADEEVIKQRSTGLKQSGGVVEFVNYPLDHPIPRYIVEYGLAQGWKLFDIVDNEARITPSQVKAAAQKISQLVKHAFPTRNLQRFGVRFILNNEEMMVNLDGNPKVCGIHYEMLYIFRDDAEKTLAEYTGQRHAY